MTENSQNPKINPTVSIIIPFYNREEFIGEAIESVLSQTEKNWELILIDDGSTDKSIEIVRQYKDLLPDKVFVLNHENSENKGAGASRNLGIVNSIGKYITFLDSDDIFFPDTLERELKAFENNPMADAVCGTLECWYSWSENVSKREKDFIIDLVLETGKLYFPPDLLVHNLNTGGRKPGINCVILKSEFAKQFELFENEYKYAWEDQVFWAKVSLYGKIFVTDAVLAKYRQHPASTCAIGAKNGQDIASMSIFLDWLENYLHLQNITNKEVWKALRSFRKAIFFETKFKKLKQLYRRILPLHIRYKLRDQLTKAKKILSRSAHRHK